MKNLQRVIKVCALIALFLSSLTLYAQEGTEEATPEATAVVEETEAVEATEPAMEATEAAEATPEAEMTAEATEVVEATPVPVVITETAGSTATVVGSGIANPALQSLIDSSGSIVEYTVTNTGTNAGIEAFCAGEADIVTTTRPFTVEEDTSCREAGVLNYELLFGYHITVVISNVEDGFLGCLSQSNLTELFAPSAEGSMQTWDDITLPQTTADSVTGTPVPEATPEATAEPLPPISILLPEDTSVSYATLDSVVPGFGLRSDVQTADVATILETVATTPGALGVVPLQAAIAAQQPVFILNTDFGAGCTAAAVETATNGQYPAAQTLYAYVNQASQDTLALLLDYMVSPSAAGALNMANYSQTPLEITELNRAILAGEAPARANTAEEVTYQVPPNLAGSLEVVGTTAGFPVADSVSNQLTATRQQLTINRAFNGQVAGIDAFCTADAQVLFVNGSTEDICAGTDATVDYSSFRVGDQAVVLVANAMDSYATCLTQDQIITIWQSASADTITTWSGVADVFPEDNLTLVGISSGNFLTDILLTPVDGVAPAVRVDVAETNNDPLYRAAAIANVPGALTYMSWADYQLVVEGGQANTQLVAVDAGSGCVVPSEETITDGTYPLARTLSMLVKDSVLATDVGQGFVWSMYAEAALNQLDSLDYVTGFTDRSIADFRADLLVAFENAEEAAIMAAEATPEATAEVTAEATEPAGE
ncbi:MAG: substrate-binding domain-containing protein [Chloroflexota bacterium]